MKVFDEIRYQDEIIDYSRFNFIGLSKKYTFKFGDFMSLGNLAENIYNGNVLLDVAKQEQRKMENMLESFIEYNPVENVYKNQKKFSFKCKRILQRTKKNSHCFCRKYVSTA